MNSWKKVKLGSLLIESKITSEIPNTDKRLRVRLNLLGVEKRPNTNDKEGATKYYRRKAGQFIYGKQNLHKGAFGIVPDELDGYESSSDIPAFDVDESCYPEWIYFFFRKGDFYLRLETLAKGVGSKRIHPDQIYDFDISLPPKNEQKKILDEIEKIELANQKLLSELTFQDDKLILLRQSILQDAMEGKLTKKWRDQSTNSNESVEDLFNRIEDENKSYRKKFKIKEYMPFPRASNNENYIEIPEKWKWCKLGDLIFEKPKNGYSPSEAGYETKTKSLKLGATTKGYFDSSEVKYIDEIIPKESHLWLKDGDILVQRSNSIEHVGVSAIYRGKNFDFIYPDLMMKIICTLPAMTEYLHIILSAPSTREYFRANATGTSGTMPKINQQTLIHTWIPLCSLEEQKQIVKEAKGLFSMCDRLKKENNINRRNAQKYFQSALIKLLGDDKIDVLSNNHDYQQVVTHDRVVKYNNNTTFMELVDLLKKHGKLHAEDLWKMSKHYDVKNIGDSVDKFYADLKIKIEIEKTIKETGNEKGYLELV